MQTALIARDKKSNKKEGSIMSNRRYELQKEICKLWSKSERYPTSYKKCMKEIEVLQGKLMKLNKHPQLPEHVVNHFRRLEVA